MSLDDDLNSTIESMYRAATSPDIWPVALHACNDLFGGAGVSLEVIDRTTQAHELFSSANVPSACEVEYLEHYVSICPRVDHGFRQRLGDIGYDAQVISEADMAKDEYYSSFLGAQGLKYYISGCLLQTPERFGAIVVQHTPEHGHVEAPEISLMRCLLPHFRQAVDLSMRWRQMDGERTSLEKALDQLREGVIVVDDAGAAVHVNAMAQKMVRDGDGVTLSQGQVGIAQPAAMQSYEVALRNALAASGEQKGGGCDITVSRLSGKAPYILAVRPYRDATSRAGAFVFIRDPAAEALRNDELLRRVFGLTGAECELAGALVKGQSLRGYADRKGLSINTVYTHYRRLKDKTRSAHQAALISTLKDIKSPVN